MMPGFLPKQFAVAIMPATHCTMLWLHIGKGRLTPSSLTICHVTAQGHVKTQQNVKYSLAE